DKTPAGAPAEPAAAAPTRVRQTSGGHPAYVRIRCPPPARRARPPGGRRGRGRRTPQAPAAGPRLGGRPRPPLARLAGGRPPPARPPPPSRAPPPLWRRSAAWRERTSPPPRRTTSP